MQFRIENLLHRRTGFVEHCTAQHSEEMLKYAEIMSLSKVITEIAHTQSYTLNGVQNLPTNNTIIHPFNFEAHMQSKANRINHMTSLMLILG